MLSFKEEMDTSPFPPHMYGADNIEKGSDVKIKHFLKYEINISQNKYSGEA
jgi:hypothetical protein